MATTVTASANANGAINVNIDGVAASGVKRHLRCSFRYDSSQSYVLAHEWSIPARVTPANPFTWVIGQHGDLKPNTLFTIKVDVVVDKGGSTTSTYTTVKTPETTGAISVDMTPISFTVHVTNLAGQKGYDRIVEIGYKENDQAGQLVARTYTTIAASDPTPTSVDALFNTPDIHSGKQFYAYANVWYETTEDNTGAYLKLGSGVSIPYANVSYATVDSYSYQPPNRSLTLTGSLHIYSDTLSGTTMKLFGYRNSDAKVEFGDIPTIGETTWEMQVDVTNDLSGPGDKFVFYTESEYRIDGRLVSSYYSPTLVTDYLSKDFRAWDSFVGSPYSGEQFSHAAWNDGVRFLQTAHEVFPDYFPDSYEIEEVAEGDPWLASDAMAITWGIPSHYYVSYDRISLADIRTTKGRIERTLQQAIDAEDGE